MSMDSCISALATAVGTELKGKQDVLVSGTNIKTINGTSLLGSGDIVISGSGGSVSSLDSLTNVNAPDTETAIIPMSSFSFLSTGEGSYVGTYSNMYDGNISTSWYYPQTPNVSKPVTLSITNVTPFKLNYATFVSAYSNLLASGFVHGSNDGTNWVLLQTFSEVPVNAVYDGTYYSANYVVNSPDYYTSYRFTADRGISYWVTREMSITGTIAGSVAGQVLSYNGTDWNNTSVKTINGNSIIGNGDIVINIPEKNVFIQEATPTVDVGASALWICKGTDGTITFNLVEG